MGVDKDAIKSELIKKSNEILLNYGEPYIVEDIAILNTKDKIGFLGNLRVLNEDSVKKIKKEIEDSFKDYGTIKVRDRKVVPCCAPSYVHVSFNIEVNK